MDGPRRPRVNCATFAYLSPLGMREAFHERRNILPSRIRSCCERSPTSYLRSAFVSSIGARMAWSRLCVAAHSSTVASPYSMTFDAVCNECCQPVSWWAIHSAIRWRHHGAPVGQLRMRSKGGQAREASSPRYPRPSCAEKGFAPRRQTRKSGDRIARPDTQSWEK